MEVAGERVGTETVGDLVGWLVGDFVGFGVGGVGRDVLQFPLSQLQASTLHASLQTFRLDPSKSKGEHPGAQSKV